MQLQFGRSLPFLMDLWNYCERVGILVKNVVQQLASIYSKFNKSNQERTPLLVFQFVHFQVVYSSLAELFGVLITMDEMIQQNQAIGNHVTLYKRMLSKVMDEPESYGTDKAQVGKVQYLLQKIEGDILEYNIFRGCISRNFDNQINQIDVHTNTIFQEEMKLNLKNYFASLNEVLETTQEEGKRSQLPGFVGLYLFYFHLYRDVTDKNIFTHIWTVAKKVPLFHLFGNSTFCMGDFLIKQSSMTQMFKLTYVKNPPKEILEAKVAYLKVLDDILPRNVNLFFNQICQWMSRIESTFSFEDDGRDVIGIQATLMVQGIQFAHMIQILLKTNIYLHMDRDKPLTISGVVHLCRCVEMLKSIKNTFHRKSGVFAQMTSFITEYLSYKIQRLLLPLKNKIENRKKHTPSELDQLSSIILSLELLCGAPCKRRLMLLRLTLPIALQQTSGVNASFEEIKILLLRLETIANFDSVLTTATDCSFIYWSRELMDIYFGHVFTNPSKCQELKHIIAALEDPKPILTAQVHLPEKNALIQNYEKSITDLVTKYISQPLCEQVERELRLLIHKTILGTDKDPQKHMKDLGSFFKIRPLIFFGNLIDFQKIVVHYLDTTFYRHTAITNSDWKTYEQMRNLALKKFGLTLNNVFLPIQTLEQGLDILVVTRNIHVFVGKYSYNLNSNMFLERCMFTEAKNLNSIHISHVTNSIRTHGIGIMNTTVNFVYKFLGKKFYIFSQFLYDDHIKSRLIKDARFYKESASKLGNKYPQTRALKFIKDIRKLGLHENKENYLSLFRNLITEIGNALGYVRMVRAGGLRYISEAIKYVPNLDDIDNFEQLAQQDNLSPETISSAKSLYSVLTNLRKKFAEGSDYFKLLEKVFTVEMNKDENNHLKNFYLIVPALTMNYVENIIIAKEKMARSGKESNFTDDGFALGVAFILKILNQNEGFDSLHWFESIKENYDEENGKLTKTMDTKKKMIETRIEKEDEHDNYMKLTLNKVKTLMKENELLFFAFQSSRIFFKD
jgi:WASH complex subunit 7